LHPPTQMAISRELNPDPSLVLNAAKDSILGGRLQSFTSRNWHPRKAPLEPDVEASFKRLNEWNEKTIDISLQAAYRSSIRDLRRAFETFSAISQDFGLVFVWPCAVQDKFIVQLKMKRPMALAILAHYAVLLHSISGHWWSDGRGSQLLEAICQKLPSTWQLAVSWPKQVIRGTSPRNSSVECGLGLLISDT